MKRHYKLCAAFFIFFLAGTLYANDEWRWDLVNALIQNDFRMVENILKENLKTMSSADKRLTMNFALTYSYGENAIKAILLLQNYNIHPNNFDLYTAINRNQPDNVINLILSNNVKANGEILLLAMEKRRFDLARQFIQTGVDVNYQYPLSKNYADGMTPLLYASKWNNFDLVKLLAENGANLSVRNRDGNTALSLARANGNTQIYNFLIEKGAVEITNLIIPPDNQTSFQTGTYRLLNGSTIRKFSGNANSGSVSYISGGNAYNGFYKTEGSLLTMMIEGRTYIYKIDPGSSLSGNGEIWVKMGN